MNVLVDTGILYAATNKRDCYHRVAAELIEKHHSVAFIPVTVLPETCFMIRRIETNRAVAQFLQYLIDSDMAIVGLTTEDYQRVADILTQYADSRIDFVDASIMAVAERLEIRRILTLDRRDFALYRPRHCSHFEILPAS